MFAPKSNDADNERLAYLVSIRWPIFIVGTIGVFATSMIFGLNAKILISGALGGLGFALGMFGASRGKGWLLFVAAISILAATYFLPNAGRAFRGQVIAYFFFVGLFVFSLILLVFKRLLKS